jgi:hypothetical protein
LKSKLVFASSLVSPLSWPVAEAFNTHSPKKSESMKQILQVGVGVHIISSSLLKRKHDVNGHISWGKDIPSCWIKDSWIHDGK